MDQLTRDLLTNWNLHEYIGAFCAGKIDAGTLRLLSNDEITQLIPIPGDRARFKANLKNWKAELKDITNISDFNETENAPTLTLLSDLFSEDAESFLVKETRSQPSPLASCSPSTLASCSPLTTKNLQSSHELSSRHPVTSTPTQDNLQKSSVTSVLETLKLTHDGRAILQQGQKTGTLNETQRNLLVKLIINPIFEENANVVISNAQLLTWALQIQDIFPNESAALYYTPYISALVRATARNASGKLLRYVYNKRRILREKGIIEGSSRSRSRSQSQSSTHSGQSDQQTLLPQAQAIGNTEFEEVEEKLTFLSNCLEPWHLVEEYWLATANYRLTKKLSGTLQEYFNEYPVLKQPAGYNLLLKDFEKLYENKSNAFYINIATLRTKIIELAQKKLLHIRDKELKHIIEKYLSAVTENATCEVINNISLLLLPFLASNIPLKDKKKGTWKPSKTEVRDGFITQIASSSDLKPTIGERIAKLHRFGKSLQPFVIFVGKVNEISECYVVAGDTYYKLDTLTHAVDVCFKIIHATGAKYQEESYVVWMIIQKGFYLMDTEYDKQLTSVNSLLVDLGIKLS